MNSFTKLWQSPAKLKSAIKLLSFILVVLGVAFVFNKYINREALQLMVKNSGHLGILVYFLVETTYITFTPFFNTFILIASGYIFGGLTGFFINFLASISSLFLIVFLVKKYGRPLLEKLVSHRFYKHFDKIIQKVGPILLLVAYVVPFSPDDELTYVVAAGPLSFKRFILPVLLGSLGKAAYSYIGDLGTTGITIAIYFRIVMLIVGLILIGIQEHLFKDKNKWKLAK